MKTILGISLLACLLAPNLSAQSNWEETRATPTRVFLFGESRSAPDRLGSHGHLGIFPFLQTNREGRALPFLSRFLPSRRHRPASARPQLFSLFGEPHWGSPYFGRSLYWNSYYNFPQPAHAYHMYNSQRFVDEWKDRDPRPDALSYSGGGNGFARSTVLAEGMTEEQVLSAVGSPVERVTMGTRSVWKYSGYSLLFEDGGLKEIR
jgi:hypothetical protein